MTAAGTTGSILPPWTLALGAMVLLALARPPLRSVRRPGILPLLGFGVASTTAELALAPTTTTEQT